ncbi:MAG: patatin-like phospholipase family protein [Bacteroidales bacterium]|jgi:NTE family protein|nr:patatin-like phospholipase family protein [Bacteroidales bacterium]
MRTKRTIFFCFALFILINTTFAQKKQSVGLVLSGGGARGLAHVGAIKALEDNNIPIDYIAGTSVGAIVGALYASGYSVEDMHKLFLLEQFQIWLSGKADDRYAFYYKMSDKKPQIIAIPFNTKEKFHVQLPSSIVNPLQMDFAFMEIFAPASAAAKSNFDSLMIPFFCVASDIEERKALIIRNGDLGQAVRASMTIPLYFAPQIINEKILFDGGMYDNFPTKDMINIYHPDVLIGVKISGNYPQAKEGDLMSYIHNFVTRETDYDISSHHGILIEPDVKDIGILEFDKMDETFLVGYNATMEKINEIKQIVKDSVDKKEVDEKRERFNREKPPLNITELTLSGVKGKQKEYIYKSLIKNKKDTNIYSSLRKNYFSLYFDRNIKTIHPQIEYDEDNKTYSLNLRVKTQENIKATIAGVLSSNPISHLYIGLDYNLLRKQAWFFQTNAYFGRYYTSFMGSIRTDYPTQLPFFTKIEFNANQWNYYSLKAKFFEYSPLNYIVQRENNVRASIGIPLRVKDEMIFTLGYARASDDYFNIDNSTIYDTADNTTFKHFAFGLSKIYSTLDDYQFPTTGLYSKINLQYINGRERFSPGNTSLIVDDKDRIHSWLQFTFRNKLFFDINKNLSIGWLSELFYSSQNLFTNYRSSLLNAGVFTPTMQTLTSFMPEYRSTKYLATGVENVFKIGFFQINASFRLNGYIYIPITQITTIENNLPIYKDNYFNKLYFILSSSLVLNTPVGPLSLIASYHQRDDKSNPFTISINFGYVMFNNRNIER